MGKKAEGVCAKCSGNRKIRNIQNISISAPPGVLAGQVLRPVDDLEVMVMFRRHVEFILLENGVDILSRVTISMFDALLGKQIEINTLGGTKMLTIPAGIQPKNVLKVKGSGMKYNNGAGDHLVEVSVSILKNLTPEQIELVEKLKEMGEA
jgi:DnaJ-class molecular chaperone